MERHKSIVWKIALLLLPVGVQGMQTVAPQQESVFPSQELKNQLSIRRQLYENKELLSQSQTNLLLNQEQIEANRLRLERIEAEQKRQAKKKQTWSGWLSKKLCNGLDFICSIEEKDKAKEKDLFSNPKAFLRFCGIFGGCMLGVAICPPAVFTSLPTLAGAFIVSGTSLVGMNMFRAQSLLL